MPLFYWAATATMKILLIAFSHWQFQGKENVPPTGPLIIVANHLNLADPPLISASIPRQVIFMAKKELFHSGLTAAIVRAFGAFPVNRNELDRETINQAIRTLEKGFALGMFPEGKRSFGAGMGRAYDGTSLIALRSQAPILPVGISGSERITSIGNVLRRPRITVNIGQPFSLPPLQGRLTKSRLVAATELIMRQIAELLPQSYRGVYGSTETDED